MDAVRDRYGSSESEFETEELRLFTQSEVVVDKTACSCMADEDGNTDCSEMEEGMLESLLDKGAPRGAGKEKNVSSLKSLWSISGKA